MPAEKTPTVPYISFRTLLNLFEKLEPEPPPRIDKSVLSYLSGGYAIQVLAALRFLGLIDADGVPSPALQELVTIPLSRKENIRKLWLRTYPTIFARKPERATAGQLEEAFKGDFGLEGETREKALAFFVHGAKFAEIPLSTLIENRVKRSTSTARKPKRTPALSPNPVTVGGGDSLPSSHASAPVHPMLAGSIQWLYENAGTPNWTEQRAKLWSDNFITSVKLVYPTRQEARDMPPQEDSSPSGE